MISISAIRINYNTVEPGLNTDTKGTRRSVRLIRVSVLSGFSEKRPEHMFYRYKD